MRRLSLLPAVLLLFAGCNDYGVFDPDYPYIEGYYDYVGGVDGRYGHSVEGVVRIDHQRGDRADVSIDWTYYEYGQPIFTIVSDYPAIADVDRDGDVYFEFEGELDFYSRPVWFRLTHDGWIQGRTMYGDWRLQTDLPTTDRGEFTARR